MIPDDFARLGTLEELDLDQNMITKLPDNFKDLKNLTYKQKINNILLFNNFSHIFLG